MYYTTKKNRFFKEINNSKIKRKKRLKKDKKMALSERKIEFENLKI